jgi:hypothetical protein
MWAITSVPVGDSGSGARAQLLGIEWFENLGWLVFGIEADGRAGLWISPDGASWTLAASPRPPVNEGYRVLDVVRGVVGGCPRLAAIGQRVGMGDGFWNNGGIPLALFSDDGLTWSLSASVPSTTTQLSGLAAADSGFVAIGTETPWPAESGERQDARVWRSSDAETWTELAPPELVDTIPLGLTTVDGAFVATGFADRVSPPQMAWVSVDGVSWEGHEALPPQAQGSIYEVADADDSLIVMVGLGERGAYASISRDGRVWASAPLSEVFAEPTGLDVRDGTVVVSGYQYCGDCASENVVWVRRAGDVDWRSVPWRDHVPDELEDQLVAVAFLDIAMNGSHTAILAGDGTVILTPGPLP